MWLHIHLKLLSITSGTTELLQTLQHISSGFCLFFLSIIYPLYHGAWQSSNQVMSLLSLLSVTKEGVFSPGDCASMTGVETMFKICADLMDTGAKKQKKKKKQEVEQLRSRGPEALLVWLLSYVRGAVT